MVKIKYTWEIVGARAPLRAQHFLKHLEEYLKEKNILDLSSNCLTESSSFRCLVECSFEGNHESHQRLQNDMHPQKIEE